MDVNPIAGFERWAREGLAAYPAADAGGPERVYIRAAELRALLAAAYRAGWDARRPIEAQR